MVENCTECVAQAVPKLTALVNGARRLRSHMASYASRERELLEESLHTFDVFTLVGVAIGRRVSRFLRSLSQRRSMS